jgi:predicted transcriptional regulator
VVSINVTVRFSEEELRRLDELAQRMGKTRSDVIRDLISKFDETLRGEVEKERRRWMAMGFVGALESIILDPTLVLRFVRRNVDVLGYPDFLIGMVRVRNRVLLFSHHDKIGHQLLQQVRARVEEEVRREEAELEQEGGGDEEAGGAKPIPTHPHVKVPIKPGTPHAVPGAHRYKVLINSGGSPPTAKPIAASAAGGPVKDNRGGSAKAAGVASVPENQKSGSTGIPTTHNLAATQTRDSGPQASAKGGGAGSVGPVGQAPVGKPGGDFVFALITNLYHKHRETLLRAIGGVVGD